MNKIICTLVLTSFTSLAQAEEYVTVPELEGGFTASVGTFYAVPSTNNQNSNRGLSTGNLDSNSNTNNQFGTQGSIGYNFDNTGNGIEFSNRRFD